MEEKEIEKEELEEQQEEQVHHDDDEHNHEWHHHHDHDPDNDDHEGHHHHHDHDFDNDNEHGEHHHHDGECDCDEHDHEGHHHHHHDDDDEHDHEGHHHHDHGHTYDVPGFRIFETHNHEGATICSFEKDINGDATVVSQNVQDAINSLERWLDETGATIGHVKGYVKESGPVITFSTVGYGLNVEQHDAGNALCVGFASIVFGPTEEELKDKVAEIFAAI